MYLARVLLAIWLIGLVGVAAELVLLEHYEDALQFLPFVAIAAGLASGVWLALRPGRAATRAFRVVIAGFLISGLVGLVLHYRGNSEFERERDPSISGLALIWESLTGATPALAPGTMILFTFIGYAVLVSRRQPPV
ncbi:MAG: hypothetical protein ACREOK_06585 [Gemmatimonadaceae bacterium]